MPVQAPAPGLLGWMIWRHTPEGGNTNIRTGYLKVVFWLGSQISLVIGRRYISARNQESYSTKKYIWDDGCDMNNI